MRHVFFAINFGIGLLILMSMTYLLGASRNGPAMMSAGMVAIVTATMMALEWSVWYRKTRETEKGLGCLIIGTACILLLSLIGNVIDSIVDSGVTGLYDKRWLLVGLVVTIGYTVWCGQWRMGVYIPPQDHRDARCEHCEYDLEGNQSGTCPECGTRMPPEQIAYVQQHPSKRQEPAPATTEP